MDEQRRGGDSESEELATEEWASRAAVDRRSGPEPRPPNGVKRPRHKARERRGEASERRRDEERRAGWMRVEAWRSVPVFDEVTPPTERLEAPRPGDFLPPESTVNAPRGRRSSHVGS